MRDLDKAIAWAVKHRRPIYLGEFGAYSKADMESRARWTRFVADEALEAEDGLRLLGVLLGLRRLRPQARRMDRAAERRPAFAGEISGTSHHTGKIADGALV